MDGLAPAIALIRAPSSLGLRPLHPGHIPGAWRAPSALTAAGLVEALAPARIIDLAPPIYVVGPQPGSRVLNGPALRAFNLGLAEAVEGAVGQGLTPLVVGGDCSILLGALAGRRRSGPLSLVHIDGHSDFRHPGNVAADSTAMAAAGMDLALATGRGEALLTDWPGISAPLIPDEQVVQLGERESRDADFAWPDVAQTPITRIDVFEAQENGVAGIMARIGQVLDARQWPFWLHLDVDVLDQTLMPAVDSPGSPGVDPEQLSEVLRALLTDRRFAGMTVTIFDPDLDPDGQYARLLVSLLADAVQAPGD